MSWWVYLTDENGKALEVQRHEEGGTYALGGVTIAELNITYNYSAFYYEHLDDGDGLRWLDGRTARHTIGRITSAIAALGTNRSTNYWDEHSGNAGYALSILLQWANMHPEGIWEVS